MAVLLVTTFAQSLQRDSGTLYFAWLIAEGLLVVWWGAARRAKVPFFIGLSASVINILSQLVLLATGNSALLRWLIIGGVGVFIVVVAVFIERQRVLLFAKAKAFVAELETWE